MSSHDTHSERSTDTDQFRAELEDALGEAVDEETAAEIEEQLTETVESSIEAVRTLVDEEEARLLEENGGGSA